MSLLNVVLERETANDEEATVVAVFVPSGTPVQRDEVLFDIENSKATQEVVAPEAGILTHDLTVGQTVRFGVPIAQIAPDGLAPRAAPAIVLQATAMPAPPPSMAIKQHFSQAARAMIAELGLDSAAFDMDFVTTRDVQAIARPVPLQAAAEQPSTPRVLPVANGPATPVNARKRAEIEALSKGAGGTMLSVLGVSLGSMAISRQTDDFLAGQITDLVIYEAARLLKKFPNLNAAYSDGQVVHHAAVHAGLAIDSGGQLVVYGIEHADRMSLAELGAAIAKAVGRYVSNQLTGAELSRATFTVTDLSGDELDFVLPLLPRGQSCILGITRDGAGYRIFAGFDHRVTEGREVASFLNILRGRLQSFATPGDKAAARCAFCERSAMDAFKRRKERGLMKITDHQGQDVLCCASCWNGW